MFVSFNIRTAIYIAFSLFGSACVCVLCVAASIFAVRNMCCVYTAVASLVCSM